MTAFSKFLDIIKAGHYIDDGERNTIGPEDIEKVSQTVPFIFAPKVDIVHLPDDSTADPVEPLDLPFKNCFFEMLGIPITKIDVRGVPYALAGIWVHESAPKSYGLTILWQKPGNNWALSFPKDREIRNHLHQIILHLLDRLSKEEIGYCNPRTSVKLKVAGKKLQYRINKIVYVSAKRNQKMAENFAGKPIEWSHQWTVRGHWRDLPGRLGKDRDGEPISGFTWVRPHVKGPENALLVQKTRLVSAPAENPKMPTN